MTENKKYEKGTLGWLREQQKIKARKGGFDNIDDWLKWKVDPFNILEKKYGKEFVDWARQNKDRVPKYWIDAGCKTDKEYRDKRSQDEGFENNAERYRDRNRERNYRRGHLPKEDNPDCTLWFGEFISQNYVMKTFEDPIEMPPNNPGFDWICKKGHRIDHKGACLTYKPGKSPGWLFHIEYNNIADYFILSAWDSRDSLNPLHIWAFHKDDIVRKGKGSYAPMIKFWRRDSLWITNTPECLKEWEKYEVTNRLEKLKELCRRKKY